MGGQPCHWYGNNSSAYNLHQEVLELDLAYQPLSAEAKWAQLAEAAAHARPTASVPRLTTQSIPGHTLCDQLGPLGVHFRVREWDISFPLICGVLASTSLRLYKVPLSPVLFSAPKMVFMAS